mmetsp:Transcript_118327/g.215232  ORF Transcript_118327/g.215232 Transcript_118327/m.215232 type:complete len:211 (-) Transcript_118327:1431-2063(-)
MLLLPAPLQMLMMMQLMLRRRLLLQVLPAVPLLLCLVPSILREPPPFGTPHLHPQHLTLPCAFDTPDRVQAHLVHWQVLPRLSLLALQLMLPLKLLQMLQRRLLLQLPLLVPPLLPAAPPLLCLAPLIWREPSPAGTPHLHHQLPTLACAFDAPHELWPPICPALCHTSGTPQKTCTANLAQLCFLGRLPLLLLLLPSGGASERMVAVCG